MADDRLKELLTSPLDPEPRRKRGADDDARAEITAEGTGEAGSERAPVSMPPWWIAAAALLGGVVVITGYLAAREEAAPTTTVATTTTSTTIAATGEPSGLPPEYVAVGDRLGMRVERILVRSDGVFVTVTTVIENSLDPEESAGFQGGIWSLVMADGSRVVSTVESFDALARGTVSIHFPPEGVVAEDIVAVEVNGEANRLTTVVTATGEAPFELGAEPVEVALDTDRFDIDADVALSVTGFALTPAGGEMTWSLEGDGLARAAVDPILRLTTTGDELAMTGHVQSSGFNFFHPSVPTALLTDTGSIGFDIPRAGELEPGPWTVDVELQITWAVYDPLVASLPVEGVPVAEVVGS